MAGWSITRRINTITLALLACILLVGVMGVASFLRLSGIFYDYRNATENLRLATDLFEDLAEAEIAELKFRTSPADAWIAEVRGNLDEIAAARDALTEGVSEDADLSRLAARIFDDEARFRAAFEEMQVRQGERDAAVASMPRAWEGFLAAIGELETLMMFQGNDRVARNLDSATRSVLTGRVHVERFLLSNRTEDMKSAGEHFDAARARLRDSAQVAATDGLRESLEAAMSGLDAYRTSFAAAVDAALAGNVQRASLDGVAGQMERDLEQLLAAVAERKAVLERSSDRLTMATLAAQVIAAILILGAGYMLAQYIARRTAAAIDTSVRQMRALAGGNHGVAITGTEHDHELGQMARALEVFRDNARAADALRAEQEDQKRATEMREAEAAKREKALEEDRARKMEETRQATIRELTQSVGAVVDAGAEGDFSRRIEARFESRELNELAAGINALVGNVESGIAETARVMEALAAGDLSDRMNGTFRGTFAALQAHVNGTIEQLADLVTQIAGQCDLLADAAGQMTAQSGDLSRRAEQQAASLEETSAAMEEISASAKSSAEGASAAADFARATSGQVDEAGSVVASAVSAMADIRDASGRINEIVAVIDGIAFQTNLLALNASVEAARAGSAGKGFAVVATEVRALAQRSGEASKDIKALIDESTTQVERGVSLVEQTGTTLEEIMDHVGRMADRMQTLTTGAREQATGVGEVSAAISQLDTITQKNAALSDQSRTTAGSVQSLSDGIREMVARFRVAETDRGADTPEIFAAE